MDLQLQEGDLARDSRGRPIAISGVEELLQRAMIRLSVRRGGFACVPELGSDLHLLKREPPQRMEQTALAYVQEALYPLGEIRVRGLKGVYHADEDRYTCTVQLQVLGIPRDIRLEL